MLRYNLLLSCFVFLGACSTVLEGPIQPIRIETPGAKDSVCYLENDKARYKVMPPQTVKITKFDDKFNVNCFASGNRKKSIEVDPKVSDNVYYNVANGVAPGLATDYFTSSMYESPELIVVDFTGMSPNLYPLPDYHHDILQNPTIFQYEEFRPGMPALQSDRYHEDYDLKKTDRAISALQSKAEPYAPYSDGSSSSAPATRGSSDADGLTRSMNPQIFYDGSGSNAGSAPTNLSPSQQ